MRHEGTAVALLLCLPVFQALAAPALAVQFSEPSLTLHAGESKQLAVAVTSATNKALTWSVNGVAGGNATVGTISASGVYTAPAAISLASVSVKAVSVQDATKSASASVMLLNPEPAISALDLTQINTHLAFSLTLTGKNFLSNATVSFDDKTPLAIKSRTATTITVTGTSSSAAGSQLHISVTNPGAGATTSNLKSLVVAEPIAVTVSPATKTMRGLTNETFHANVANASTHTVTWAVNGVAGGNATLGLISPEGVYTAPGILPGAVTIGAASTVDPTKSGTAQITLQNPVPVVASATSPVTAGSAVNLTIAGNGFAKGAQVTLGGSPLAVSWIGLTQLKANGAIAAPAGGVLALRVINPDPGSLASNTVAISVKNAGTQLSYAAAKRFLEQATWGPTAASIAHLQSIGIDAWLDEQLDANRTPISTYTAPVDDTSNLDTLQKQFFKNAVSGPDQLRQRMAFALGQIAVVSGLKLGRYDQMMPYQQLLLNAAFSKYKDFLKEVTLSPAMGHYLDMVNNDVPSAKTSPDENYAREFMQLFTIGLNQLNASAVSNGANTYSEADVKALARVFTGWTYAPCLGVSKWPNPPCFQTPLVVFEAHHDNGVKEFLGTNIGTGSAEGDLDQALATVESYRGTGETVPNIAPFVALRLIQHLVTGEPAPDYVARVAAVYVSSGGDLGQMARAILKDPAAGYGDNGAPLPANQGHLREPVFYAVSLLRALGAALVYDPPLASQTNNMGQNLFYSPSVFNYYSPFYHVPGTPQVAPEFQILSQATAFYRANYAYRAMHNQISTDIAIDLTNFAQLAADTNAATQSESLATLLNAISEALLGAPMTGDMQAAILPALLATNNATARVQTALYLVAASPQYQIQR